MATRNRTTLYRKYRDSLRTVRGPAIYRPWPGDLFLFVSVYSIFFCRGWARDRGGYRVAAASQPFVRSAQHRRSWNFQRSLATDLKNVSTELRKKQSTYLKRFQQQREGQDGVDLEMNLSKVEDDDFSNVGFNEYQMSKLKRSEAFTAEREREITQVVESVKELAQIMKDLSVLVIDQGTIVDRIDYNIQNVAASVEEGFKQLQKAEKTQRKGGMVMCTTVLVIMCFIMLVLLILKEIFL